MKLWILLIVIYNLIFIPLQFGYRIPFKGIYLVMEILTWLLYIFDIIYRSKNLKELINAGGNLPQSENEVE
jgi:hypothetical protein